MISASVISDAAGVVGLLVGIFALILGATTAINRSSAKEFSSLREENTAQHLAGRIRVDEIDSKLVRLQTDMTEVRERTARLEGGQAALAVLTSTHIDRPVDRPVPRP